MLGIPLEVCWYVIFIVVIMAYVVLDGFDLGVGCLHLFLKTDLERRILLSSIGPLWDGNSVWLVIIVGGLFAGFPEAYAVIFSLFYLPLMVLVCSLIFRAVSIEFRSKMTSSIWRSFWDLLFGVSSFAIAFSLGCILGNFVIGVPLIENQEVDFSHLNLYHPYAMLIGVMAVTLFSLHGALFLLIKTQDALFEKLSNWSLKLIALLTLLFVGATQLTWMYYPHMAALSQDYGLGLVVVTLLNVGLIMLMAHFVYKQRPVCAFLCSCALMILLILVYALGSYPYLLRSNEDVAYSLTIFNSASSPLTLKLLLGVVAIGVPFAVLYTIHAYKIFRGKISKDHLVY